jgi:hypothetical protein
MNIAATKTAPTATFWLIRRATASLSPRQRLACGFGTPAVTRSRTHPKFRFRVIRQDYHGMDREPEFADEPVLERLACGRLARPGFGAAGPPPASPASGGGDYG